MDSLESRARSLMVSCLFRFCKFAPVGEGWSFIFKGICHVV